MIRLQRVSVCDKLYNWATDLLAVSFPPEERRDDDFQKSVMNHKDYRLCVILDSELPVGVAGYFDADEFIYFENFCVEPNKRNCGYGSATLTALTSNLQKPFILEAELPTDELTRRRISFYKRNGMVENPYPHIQPHYRKTDTDLPLVVLTYGKQLSQKQYDLFRKYLDDNVDVK